MCNLKCVIAHSEKLRFRGAYPGSPLVSSSPRCLVCVLKKKIVLRQIIIWCTREPRQQAKQVSPLDRRNSLHPLRVRAGLYWIRVHKCLNAIKHNQTQ